jgi:hypothetical protein
MTLRRRIAKLAARHSEPANGPRVVYIGGPDGDPRAAFIIGGGENVVRLDGETAAAFEARAMMAAGHEQA